MSASSHHPDRAELTRASSSVSINSAITIDEASNAKSSSSTPPTSIGDSGSISSTSLKLDDTLTTPPGDTNGYSRRSRTSVGTYNVKVLSGTAIHAPKKFSKESQTGNVVPRRRTISGDTLVDHLSPANSPTDSVRKDAGRLVREGIEALDLEWSVKNLPTKSRSELDLTGSPRKSLKQQEMDRRKSTRSTVGKFDPVSEITRKFAIGMKKLDDGASKAKRELRNLADTKEFAKIDIAPVIHEVWSKGKLVVPEPPQKKKKKKSEEDAAERSKPEEPKPAEKRKAVGKKQKVWLNKGLYAGQQAEKFDWFSSYTPQEREKMEIIRPIKENKYLPLPMWHGQRLLHVGRDFKLPFDVCSPLPPGQPKPDEWRKTSSNRFIGNAAAQWKKSTLFDSFSSKCVCTPQGGCDVDCQNRIMLYECDDTNCGAGRDRCTNRAFADLQERRKGGNKYRIGVEVIKTADRGYGVRSNRCFDPHQIIVEYTGEIITEDECDRRMNEDYKDNECYYLMSFDQNMIIDATKGSIARFVNHSCKPNCRMVKWIVGGKPRMALFAGDDPIMTGDELTYDYNFDPFSAKNVQECRCGSDNCRGVLGPRPKDPKFLKDTIKDTVKATVKVGKRKLKEFLNGEGEHDSVDSNARSPKKRKIKEAKGIKRSSSSASMRVAHGAKALKKSFSTQLLNARQAVSSKRGKIVTVKKTMKSTIFKSNGKGRTKLSSRNSSLTIVANEISPRTGKPLRPYTKRNIAKNVVTSIKGRGKDQAAQTASESTIRVILGEDDEE